jgi:hypothetical protein
MSNFYRGTSIDASYQVSVYLTMRVQRRRSKKIGQSETRIACGSHVPYFSEPLILEFGQRDVFFYLQKVNKH